MRRIRDPNESVQEYGRRYKARLYLIPTERARILEQRRALYARRAQAIHETAAAVGCERCGTKKGPFEFHHRNPDVRKFNITPSGLIGQSVEEQWAEVRACDIVCRSCHAKAHHRERNCHK